MQAFHGPRVTYPLAGSLDEPAAQRFVRDGKKDLVAVAWLQRCCAQRRKLPIRPADWLHLTPATRRATEGITQHGDQCAPPAGPARLSDMLSVEAACALLGLESRLRCSPTECTEAPCSGRRSGLTACHQHACQARAQAIRRASWCWVEHSHACRVAPSGALRHLTLADIEALATRHVGLEDVAAEDCARLARFYPKCAVLQLCERLRVQCSTGCTQRLPGCTRYGGGWQHSQVHAAC